MSLIGPVVYSVSVLYIQWLCWYFQVLPLHIRNDGTLTSKVDVDLVDPDGAFSVAPSGSTQSVTSLLDRDGRCHAKGLLLSNLLLGDFLQHLKTRGPFTGTFALCLRRAVHITLVKLWCFSISSTMRQVHRIPKMTLKTTRSAPRGQRYPIYVLQVSPSPKLQSVSANDPKLPWTLWGQK